MEKDNDLIFGIHSVLEYLQEVKPVDQVLIKKNSDNEKIREIIYLCRKQGITVKSVPPEKLDRITRKNHQGVIAFASPIEFSDIKSIIPKLYEEGKNPLIVILDEITDVRNFGAIVRSCECFGVDAVVIPHKGAAKINSEAAKTSAGAIFKIPVCKTHSLPDVISFLKESGLLVFGITEKSKTTVFNEDFSVPTAIILGNEETGIDAKILEFCTNKLAIPMTGTISSLNVSVAAGICLYEIAKQRF